jgi:hypothetical protein
MRKPSIIFSAIVVPFLVLVATLFLWSGLNAIGFFNSASTLSALALPFCTYSAAMIVWILNPVRWEIVPVVVAFSTSLSFLLGAAILTNSVGLGFNPIPVFEIFFTAKGLNQTLPYFLDETDALNSNHTIFQFLITPIITAAAGLFLGCLLRREKLGNLNDRAKQGGIRLAIVTLAFVVLSLGARSS